MTQLVGKSFAGLPSTVTHTCSPISAVALGTVVLIFVSVNRPVTRSGRMSNVTPFPLDVEMSASKLVNTVPPTKFPLPNVPAHAGLLVVPLQIAQEAEVPAALKLPLDAARAVQAANAPIITAQQRVFILPPGATKLVSRN